MLAFLLLLLLPTSMMADSVSVQKAQRAAESFFGLATGTKGAPSLTLLNPTTKAGETPDYYIYSFPKGGFVIIAGEDASKPVIGYSRTSTFDMNDMPDGLVAWLGELSDDMRYLRSNGIKADAWTAAKWEALTRGDYSAADQEAGGKLLQTATWLQRAPFNNLCPKVGGEDVPAGCVAIATAVIMRYHRWPEKGSGTLPSYTYYLDAGGYRTQQGHTLGEVYDWDNILLKYPTDDLSQCTQQQQDAVARLVYDVGIMVKMNYNPDGSGAYAEDVPGLLAKHMGYCSGSKHVSRGSATTTWIAKIKNAIDSDLPILYSGQSGTGGHAFVVDGYDAEDNLHINFGQTSHASGYYALPNFSVYSRNHAATFDLRPDNELPSSEESFLKGTLVSYDKTSGDATVRSWRKASFELTSDGAAVASEAMEASGGVCHIHFHLLPHGQYRLKVTAGSYSKIILLIN